MKDLLKSVNISCIEGVEPQKNIICGETVFKANDSHALLKIMVTGNGLNCEITGRSNESEGKFIRLIVINVLELIANKNTVMGSQP